MPTLRRLVLAAALLACPPFVAAQEPIETPQGRTYTPADFSRYAPRNALDMLEQVPGFVIRQETLERETAELSVGGEPVRERPLLEGLARP